MICDQEKVHEVSVLSYLFDYHEIIISSKIHGAYIMMGLIEQKCAKYIKILITKARCICTQRGLVVSKMFPQHVKISGVWILFTLWCYITQMDTCVIPPPFREMKEWLNGSDVTFATFSAPRATQKQDVAFTWNHYWLELYAW